MSCEQVGKRQSIPGRSIVHISHTAVCAGFEKVQAAQVQTPPPGPAGPAENGRYNMCMLTNGGTSKKNCRVTRVT